MRGICTLDEVGTPSQKAFGECVAEQARRHERRNLRGFIAPIVGFRGSQVGVAGFAALALEPMASSRKGTTPTPTIRGRFSGRRRGRSPFARLAYTAFITRFRRTSGRESRGDARLTRDRGTSFELDVVDRAVHPGEDPFAGRTYFP